MSRLFDDNTVKRLFTDLLAAYDNLTVVQTRCTELLEENRRLKAELDRMREKVVVDGGAV